MSQNRDAPAYQEYAAAMMAKLAYRTMSLQERGLAWTMRNECWVNGRLPGRHDLLAKVLGVSEQEIDDSLPAVMAFFEVSEGAIFCPELEDYRKHLEEQKAKKIAGGKLGATITNKKKKNAKSRMDNDSTTNPTANPSSIPTTDPQHTRRVKVGSLVQSSTVKPSQVQSLEKEVVDDPFVVAMEEEEARQEASSRVKVRV